MRRMTRAFAAHPFDTITEAELRTRESAKWRAHSADVLPSWIAEMDVPLAPPIARVLREAIERQDCGYATATGLGTGRPSPLINCVTDDSTVNTGDV